MKNCFKRVGLRIRAEEEVAIIPLQDEFASATLDCPLIDVSKHVGFFSIRQQRRTPCSWEIW